MDHRQSLKRAANSFDRDIVWSDDSCLLRLVFVFYPKQTTNQIFPPFVNQRTLSLITIHVTSPLASLATIKAISVT